VKAPALVHINRRAATLVGAGTFLMIVVGIAAYMMLSNPSPTAVNLRAGVERYLARHPDFGKERYCITNFDYTKDIVNVEPYDRITQQWLGVLVRGGMYVGPVDVVNGKGFFANHILRYTKTSIGRTATASGALCFATGLLVAKIEAVRQVSGRSADMVSARVSFSLTNAAPWIRDPAAVNAIPGHGENYLTTVYFVARERRWEVAEGDDNEIKEVSSMQSESSEIAKEGILDRLTQWFSFGGNPLLGQWQGYLDKTDLMKIKFEPGVMLIDGRPAKVHYEIKDKLITIRNDGNPRVYTVHLLDAKHFVMNFEGLSVEAERQD
jgi:hypothetical protein